MTESPKPRAGKKKKLALIILMLAVMVSGIIIILDAKANVSLDPSLMIPCDELIISDDGNFVNCKAKTPNP